MRTPQHPSQPFAQITAIVVLTLAVAACINPFSSADRDSSVDGSSRFGRLELRLAEEGIGAQTVLPGPVTPDAYDVILTRDGFDDVAVLGVASTTVTVPGLEVGEWSLVVTAFIAGQSVMRTAPDLTVEIQTGVNTFPVQLLPISEGTGSILVTVSWPAGLVNGFDAGSSSISDLLGGPPAPITGDVSITGNTLTYENAAIGAGFFQLRIVLTNNGVVVATVFEIVHVYQNLQSTKTIALTAAQISAPPAAPESLFLEQVSPTIVRLTWNDASNTETGFRVFRDGTPVTDLPAGSQTYDDTGFTAGANTLYEVRSFNTFGESSPLSVGPVVPIGAVTLASPAISATSVPTRPLFEWSGGDGATAFDLYVEDQSANIVFQQFGIAGSSYQTTLAQQLTRDTTYNWYVVPRNATLTQIPAGGSQPFTVRGPVLFVSSTGVDALVGGTTAANPLQNLQFAMDIAEVGDELRIAVGEYSEPFSTPALDLTVTGGWDAGFGTRISAREVDESTPLNSATANLAAVATVFNLGVGSPILLSHGTATTVTVDGIYVQSENSTVLSINGSNASLRNSVIVAGLNRGDRDVVPGADADAISISGLGEVELLNNVLDLADVSAHPNRIVGGIAFNLTGTIADPPVMISQNEFRISVPAWRVLGTKSFSSATRNVTLSDNSFQLGADTALGEYSWATRFQGSQNVDLIGNTVTIPASADALTHGAFDLGSDGTVLVADNQFFSDDGAFTQAMIDIRASQSAPVSVVRNRFLITQHSGAGTLVRQSANTSVLVANNHIEFVGNTPTNLRFVSVGPFGINGDGPTTVAHNTLVYSAGDPGALSWTFVHRGGVTGALNVVNNLVDSRTVNLSGYMVDAANNTNLLVEHNAFAGYNSLRVNGVNYPTVDALQTALAQTARYNFDGSLSGLELIDTDGIFQPTTNTPVTVRAGAVPVGGVTTDLFESTRTDSGNGGQAIGYTMGAVESDLPAFITSISVTADVGAQASGDLFIRLRRSGTQLFEQAVPLGGLNAGVQPVQVAVPDVEIVPGELLELQLVRQNGHDFPIGDYVFWQSSVNSGDPPGPYPWGSGPLAGVDFVFSITVRPAPGLPPVADQSQPLDQGGYFVDNDAMGRVQTFVVGAALP